VLPRAITPQLLQAIPRRNAQIVEVLRRVEQHQLSEHHAVQVSWQAPHRVALEQALRVAVREALDDTWKLGHPASNVKR